MVREDLRYDLCCVVASCLLFGDGIQRKGKFVENSACLHDAASSRLPLVPVQRSRSRR